MAYGNYGAYVYKNDVRQFNREDNTPYKEDAMEAGYAQAFMRDKGCDPHHASLGSGLFRLCAYKCYPLIYWKGKGILTEQYLKEEYRNKEYWSSEDYEIEGSIEGYKFRAKVNMDDSNVEMELIEPDGTKWTALAGYGIGTDDE